MAMHSLKMNTIFFSGSFLLCLVLNSNSRTVPLQEEPLDSVQEVLRSVELMHAQAIHPTICSCFNFKCSCCLKLHVPEIKLKEFTCIDVAYLPLVYALELAVTINKWILVNDTVSVYNPPPLCFGMPLLKEEASACLVFYDFDIRNRTLDGCLKLTISLFRIHILNQKFGCVNFPLVAGESLEGAQRLVESLRQV